MQNQLRKEISQGCLFLSPGNARLKVSGAQGRGGSRAIHRTSSDCSSALQRLRAMHAELPSINLGDFTPSIRDLESLDANPRRELTTAISRSRSSSQRHRRPPSVRSIGRYLVSGTTPTSAAARAGEHAVERSHSLRAQPRPEGAGRVARRGSGVAAVAPRRTQSLRQASERPVLRRQASAREEREEFEEEKKEEQKEAEKEEQKEAEEDHQKTEEEKEEGEVSEVSLSGSRSTCGHDSLFSIAAGGTEASRRSGIRLLVRSKPYLYLLVVVRPGPVSTRQYVFGAGRAAVLSDF